MVNITDVGHAVSDADTGEDKMEVAAARERRSVLEIAEFYTRVFFDDLAALNVLPAAEYPRASAYVPQMIEFAATLEQRGYTYRLPSGLYFDTARDPRYGELAQLHAEGQREAARVEHVAGRRSKTDFALWRTEEPGRRRVLRWDSPWGWGTPGWHLECSVMSIALLGPHFDIHTGGIDHRELHHVNEIAQSEAFLADGRMGTPWVRYWLHNEFLQLGGAKMAKSAGGAPRLADLTEAGYHPAAFRLFLLGGHYRSQLDFTTAAIDAAQATLRRLAARVQPLRPLPAIETLDASSNGRPSRRPRPGPHRRRHLGRLQHPEAPGRVPGRPARPRDHPGRPAHRNRRRRRAARPGPGHPRPGRPGRPPRPRRPHRRGTARHRAARRRPHPGPQGTRLGPRRPDPRRTRRPGRPGHRHPRRPRLAAPLAPLHPSAVTSIRDNCWPDAAPSAQDGRDAPLPLDAQPSRATLSASSTKLRTTGRSSPARQATHSDVSRHALAGTKTRPGRALNASDDAGHKLMPRPATTCSRHSSIVRASAPMTGTSPPGRGLTSHSSRQRAGAQPSAASAAATHGSPATSASSSTSRPASG